MKFNIVSDLPGRMRLRYGANVFTAELESAVTAYFKELPYVKGASACYHTGSVLLQYDFNARRDLLFAARDIRFSALTVLEPEPENETLRALDTAFKHDVWRMITAQLARRWFLPTPLRYAYIILKAIPFAWKGIRTLMSGQIKVEVLDGAAITASIIQGNFSTAGSIMFLLGLSERLEAYAMERTKSMLSSNMLINAETVWVQRSGKEVQIPITALAVGDRVIVHTGITIPVDGTVLGGEAMVNQAAMTGEPLAVFKKTADSVFAGTVVEDGNIIVETRSLPGESRISQIVDLISESENLKASIQSKAERIADGIVPVSFVLSIGVLALTRNVSKALSVLLVDYSCAVKLATPISVISAMSEAVSHRIVVKGGKFFEAIAKADTVVFDKTGTLTEASPRVSQVVSVSEDFNRDEVLRLAACMEEHFPHSVARAVVEQAQKEGLNHEEQHTEVQYIVAHGIVTTIFGKRAIIGSYHFVFEDENVPLTDAQKAEMDEKIGGDSAIYLAVDGKLVGFLCISDQPRAEARETIRQLRALGIKQVVMLTGDNEASARVVSEQFDIDRYYAGVLPEDKASIIETLKHEGHTVIMVGDGINDSPALAAADVSVSMKDSSDIAREVADITLLESDLSQLVTARILGQRLMERITENFNVIIGFNSALILLGVTNVITPNLSAILHNTSTILIAAASTRPCLPVTDNAAVALTVACRT